MGIRSRVEAKLINIEPYTFISPAVLDKMIGQQVTINGLAGMVITNAWVEDYWIMIECYIGNVEFMEYAQFSYNELREWPGLEEGTDG